MEQKFIYQTTTKSGKEIKFRYPTIDDVEILMNYINKISIEKSFITFQGEQQTFESETKWLNDKLKKINKKECVSILSFINNELIGCSEVELESLIKKHVGVFGISVAKEFRGEGIGNILMDLVIKEAIKNINDLKIIILECFGSNTIGLNLYKKLGFIGYGRLPNGLKRLEKFDDAVLMYKKVN